MNALIGCRQDRPLHPMPVFDKDRAVRLMDAGAATSLFIARLFPG